MKRSKLVVIDNLFLPFYWVTSTLSAFIPIAKNNTNKILIIKFFGIGSITRIATALKNTSSSDQFVLLTLKRNQSVVDLLEIDAIYINDQNVFTTIFSALGRIFSIWKLKLDRVVDMERSSNLAGIFGLTAAFRKRYARFHLGEKNYKRMNQQHISLIDKSAYMAIYELLNLEPKTTVFSTKNKPIQSIVVNINAGDYLPERKFPIKKWVDLVAELALMFPKATFHLSGLKNETAYVNSFYAQLTDKIDAVRIVNQCGQLNLNEFVDLLKTSDLFFTNDSGPLHLAYYYSVKTVAIWGPTSDYLVGYQNSNRMLNLVNKQACSPCFIGPKSKVAQACNQKLTCFATFETKQMIAQIKTFAENE